jgi:UDP-GlcNAc:undecaprenyl-phosphate/decaprenyl-phosphate GlcNAc-1-phosphate transferase
MPLVLLSFFTAFALTYAALPSIIEVAIAKKLVDEPGGRRSHTVSTPSLGGIGIYAGAVFSLILWTPFNSFSNLQYILCGFLIIFLVGAKDDISPMSVGKKMMAELIAASIIVFKSDIRLEGLYGLFGLQTPFPPLVFTILTIFTIVVLINAFNLIDGINGLAGSVSALTCITLGIWFLLTEQHEFVSLSFAAAGATIAFLRYNFTPARIFMGDTGALLLGMIGAILIIRFISSNEALPLDNPYRFNGGPVVAIAVLIIPVFDTLRVFVTRVLRGGSPFTPDRRHIHHLLIDSGCSHLMATGILVAFNMLAIALVFALHRVLDMHLILLILALMAGLPVYALHRMRHFFTG